MSLENIKVTKASFSCGRTLNLGNFQSFRFDFGLEAECDEKDYEKVVEELKDECMRLTSDLTKAIIGSRVKEK